MKDEQGQMKSWMKGIRASSEYADWKGEEFDMIKNERIRIYSASQEQMEK